MIHRITVPIENRDNVVFDMELGDDNPQDLAIKSYLRQNCFPEAELIQVLVRAIHPGDYVVDCGACTGFFTLIMAALGAFVIAIEPGVNNLPALYHNIRLNKFSIDAYPVALGNLTENRDFLLIEDGGANSFTQPVDRSAGQLVSVFVHRLENLLHKSPRLIKMDIEGSEFEVLESWLKGPWTCPYIVIEYNLEALNRAGHSGTELRALMRLYGYEMFMLFADGMMPMYVPEGVQVVCSRQNTNVLFCRVESIRELWPELRV